MNDGTNFDDDDDERPARLRPQSTDAASEFDGTPFDGPRNDEAAQRRKALIVVAMVVFVGLIAVGVYGFTQIFGNHGATQAAYATPTSSPGGPEPAGTFGESAYAPTEARVTPAPPAPPNPYVEPTATADPLALREQAEQRQLQQQQAVQADTAREAQAQQLAQQQDAVARQSQAQPAAVPPLPGNQSETAQQPQREGNQPPTQRSNPTGRSSGEFDVGYGSSASAANPATEGSAYAPGPGTNAGLTQTSGRGSSLRNGGEAAHADRQIAFVEDRGDSSGTGYVPPVSHYLINPTTTITARLISNINSDLPGPVEAEVTQRVYTSNGHRVPVIMEGTRVFGTYDSAVISGQNRLLMAWTELDFANGCSFHMGAQPGTDAEGRSGLSGRVDTHSLQLFRSAALLTVLGVAEGILVPQNASILSQQTITQQVGAAAGAQLSQLGNKLIDRSLDRQPTITIDSPYEFQIIVTKPLPLDEYQTSGNRCFQSAS